MLLQKIKDKTDKKHYIIISLISIFIMTIYFPSINNYLRGDDYEWLNESYGAINDPFVLFKTINNFFRPMIKISYLFNHFFFWY